MPARVQQDSLVMDKRAGSPAMVKPADLQAVDKLVDSLVMDNPAGLPAMVKPAGSLEMDKLVASPIMDKPADSAVTVP